MLRPITVDRVNDPVDIYASDDSRIYASILGGEGIHNIGSCMSAEAVGANQLRINDGVASVQGRMAIIDPGDSELVTLDVGVSGYKRSDLVVLDFLREGNDEIITLKAVKGKQGSVATDPTIVKQDITKGGTHRQVPLWRVTFDGTLIKSVERYSEVLPAIKDLVKSSDSTKDIVSGTNLSTFMATAKEFVCYRKPTGVSISNGIPDSTNTYCFYIKMRTMVLGYRVSDHTLWFSQFINNTLDAFSTYVTPSQITDAVNVTTKGKYVADAYAIKILTDSLKKYSEKMVTKEYEGSTDMQSMTNLEQWARTADNYSFFRKAENVAITNGIPDSTASVCFYVRMGVFVLGHRASDKSLWMAPFYNNALYDFVELTNNDSVKFDKNLARDIPAGSFLGNFMPAADNYRIYRKDKSVSITGGLPNSSGQYEFFVKLGTIVLGYSTNGHFYLGACLNNTMEQWAELPDPNGVMSGLTLNKVGSGQLTLLTLNRNNAPVMAVISEADGSIRFATYNGTQYIASPVIMYRNGNVDIAGALNAASAEIAGLLKANMIKVDETVWGAGYAQMFSNNPFIEMHYGKSKDYTARLIQTAGNILRFEIVNTAGEKGFIELYKSNDSSNPITIWRPTNNGAGYLGDSSHKWNTVYAVNTQIQSDRKDKRDISDINKAMEFVMGLEPKQYKLKNSDTKEGRIHYGFIAQDVAKLAQTLKIGDLSMYQAAKVNEENEPMYYDPDAKENVADDDLMWSLNYNEITPLLVEAIKHQQKQIDELKASIESLKNDLESL